ncbi:MAG: ATP-dependent zinc metalloprotease FtsH [Clostridiales bacterium]|nr:ATP-dependent zinc metalloprotease FtsH [Clostridiales bacterium]
MTGFRPKDNVRELQYSELLTLIGQDGIANVHVKGLELTGRLTESAIPEGEFGERYDVRCRLPSIDGFHRDINALYAQRLGVAIDQVTPKDYTFTLSILQPDGTPWWMEWLPLLLPLLLFVFLWSFIMRQQANAGKSGMMTFGKSRARITDPKTHKVTFQDVAGAEEEKEELREIVEFLKNPKRFTSLGARIPKGVLLVGPPGTGKTLLARAVAGEAGVPFFTISGSDFVEMFVGVGASRVRDLFEQAKKSLPAIVFIDEIDAVGRQRGAGLGGGHDEREQTLNQLLVEMDGFSHNEGVIVMAATNRADILDPALLRPGRFDRQITVNYPDVKGREEILKVHSRGKPLAEEADLGVLALRTPYFTGADLENVMNEAAILAARTGETTISMEALEEAITKVSAGAEKKSHRVTDQDKRLVAYHEAGHAVVMHHIPECDRVHEISIIPRTKGAGGYTMYLPEEEINYVSSTRLKAQMTGLLGGHCAERLVLGDVSTGSTSDIKRATKMARDMVTVYGMSEKLGPIFLGGDHEVFLGRDFSQPRSNFSEAVNAQVDEEIRALLQECNDRATGILEAHRQQLEAVAEALIRHEKLDRAGFEAIINGVAAETEA